MANKLCGADNQFVEVFTIFHLFRGVTVVRLIRVCGVAVAILLTAMVGRSNADLVIEMDAAGLA